MTDPAKAKRLLVVAPAISSVSAAIAAGLLFKHGSELVFGLQARTWGFAVLALSLFCIAGAIAVLMQPHKPEA